MVRAGCFQRRGHSSFVHVVANIDGYPLCPRSLPWDPTLPRNCLWLPKCYRTWEAKQQYCELTGKICQDALACVGGGSNAIGLFHPFVEDESRSMYGAEAAGLVWRQSITQLPLTKGCPGISTVCSWMCPRCLWTNLRSLLIQQVWTPRYRSRTFLTTTISLQVTYVPVTDEKHWNTLTLVSCGRIILALS